MARKKKLGGGGNMEIRIPTPQPGDWRAKH